MFIVSIYTGEAKKRFYWSTAGKNRSCEKTFIYFFIFYIGCQALYFILYKRSHVSHPSHNF